MDGQPECGDCKLSLAWATSLFTLRRRIVGICATPVAGDKKVGWASDWIRQPEKGGAASVGVAWLTMLFELRRSS